MLNTIIIGQNNDLERSVILPRNVLHFRMHEKSDFIELHQLFGQGKVFLFFEGDRFYLNAFIWLNVS